MIKDFPGDGIIRFPGQSSVGADVTGTGKPLFSEQGFSGFTREYNHFNYNFTTQTLWEIEHAESR